MCRKIHGCGCVADDPLASKSKLHMSQLQLKFGSYCQVAEDVTPRNSLAVRTRRAISMGPSGNLSGVQRFLALDTSKMIVRNCWKD